MTRRALRSVAMGVCASFAHPIGVIRRERPDDFLGRLQLRASRGLLGDCCDPLARLAHEVAQLVRRRRAELDQAPSVAHQRVARLDLLDLRDRPIGGLGVAAGVPPQTDGAEVQEDRLARGADVSDGAFDGRPDLVDLSARLDVAQVRHRAERGLDPAVGGRHADAGAIVLAHEQQRHRQAHAHGIARRVDRGECRRVVGARVAEGADDHGVLGQVDADADALGARETEREAHRLRKMAGDRARLRGNPQRPAAPHLVASLGDRVLARGDDAEQRVEHRRASRQLARTSQDEATRPVVEERRVVDAKLRTDHGVVLVAGRADRVETAPGLLQLTRRDVDLTRCELVLEEPERRRGGQGRAGMEGRARGKQRGGRLGAGEVGIETVFDDRDAIPGHTAGPAWESGWGSGAGP